MIAANASSSFGSAHGFDRLSSYEEFCKAVPVAGYDAFAPWIDRAAAGEPKVLTAAPVIAFEQTGGSASGSKLIPYTRASLDGFRAAILPWLDALVRAIPGIASGSFYASLSPATREARSTGGGIPIGVATDAAYLGEDLIPSFVALLAVSPEVGAIADVGQWRLETLAQLVARADLSFVSVWSPTFFLDLINAIQPLADDIAAQSSSASRERLGRALAGGHLDLEQLWPNLACISCWADGASAPYASRLAEIFPQARVEPKGLVATEGALTIALPGEEGAVPALTSAFLEFIDGEGCSRLAHQLEMEAVYRLVMTTWGGLWRYDIGDVVRCVGHRGRAPLLSFEGRADFTSDLVGEKLAEAFVARVLQPIGQPAVLVARHERTPFYELWTEAESSGDLAQTIDRALQANPQYAYARKLGQLGPVRPVCKPGFMAKIIERRVAAGARLGDIKAIALLSEGEGGQ